MPDSKLYEWKRLNRGPDIRDHVWVEPGDSIKLLLGSIALGSSTPLTVFQLSEQNALSFRTEGTDILLTSLRITSLGGQEVVRVESNNLRHKPREDVTYRRVPGRVDIFVPATEEFIPAWVLDQKRRQDSSFGLGNRIKCLGLRVEAPVVLRVEGVWTLADRAIVITRNALSLCRPDLREPLSMMGAGVESVLKWEGPITAALFQFG